MFPRFSDLINHLLGTHLTLPFRTYGTMLALAFVAGGLIVRSELRRKEREGLLPAVAGGGSDAPVSPYRHTWSILLVGLVTAIVGSKLFDLFDNIGAFLHNPVAGLLSFNGFSFIGGLVMTVPALILYMRYLRLDWRYVIDATAPGIALGYAIGRLGCQLSGDGCWGIANTLPQPDALAWLPHWAWAFDFPHNVLNAGGLIEGCRGANCRVLEQPVWPTSLYESAMAFLIFSVLWGVRRRMKVPVTLFGLFLVLYSVERLLIEQIRVNVRHTLLGLQVTQAEVLSVGLLLVGIGVMAYQAFFSPRRR